MPHSCSFKWNMLYNVVHPAWCLSPPWLSRSSARNGTKKSSKVNPSHEPARFLRTRDLVKTYCWFAASGLKISVRNRLLPEWGCGCVWECRTKDNKKVTLDVGLNIKNAVGGRRRRRARRCSRRRSNHPSVCVCCSVSQNRRCRRHHHQLLYVSYGLPTSYSLTLFSLNSSLNCLDRVRPANETTTCTYKQRPKYWSNNTYKILLAFLSLHAITLLILNPFSSTFQV